MTLMILLLSMKKLQYKKGKTINQSLDILLLAMPIFELPKIKKNEITDFYNKKNEFPMGLMSVASFLDKSNFNVEVYCLDNYLQDSFDQSLFRAELFVKQLIEANNPQTIGISISYKIQENFSRYLIKSIRKNYPAIPIVIGGSHVTASPYSFLNLDVNIIRGEGEKAVLAFLLGNDTEKLHVRQPPSKLKLWSLTQRIEDKDLPAINYNLIKLPKSLQLSEFSHFLPLSRGCVGKCFFCTSPTVWAGGIKRKPIEQVWQEIKKLTDLGVETIDIVDDVINSDEEYFNKICEITQAFSFVQFPVMSRLDLLSSDALQKMSKSGMNSLYVGVESTQKQVLRKMNKGLNPLNFLDILKHAKNSGIRVGTFWMFGHPNATKSIDLRSAREIYKWLDRKIIDEVGCGFFLPVPGTFSSIDSAIQLLDLPSESWTGAHPVHRLVDQKGKLLYHEDEMKFVLTTVIEILAKFNLRNNEINTH